MAFNIFKQKFLIPESALSSCHIFSFESCTSLSSVVGSLKGNGPFFRVADSCSKAWATWSSTPSENAFVMKVNE